MQHRQTVPQIVRYFAFAVVGFVAGCAAAIPQIPPTVSIGPAHRPEERALPPDPATELLPIGVNGAQDWVESLEAGSCTAAAGTPVAGASRPCPVRSGILMGEGRAARDGLFRIRYVELRRVFDADRMVWGAQRVLYETRLQQADQALRDAQPTWFQQHASELGIIAGFVLGTGLTLGVMAIVEQSTRTTP
jgi:hypothetical protein